MSRALKSIPIYLAFILIIVFLFSLKTNYFVDELWSYGLANNDDSHIMLVEAGKTYEDPEEPFLEWMTVKEGHRFDYAKVWRNQGNDNHPILYYTLLHTICSFFPGQFSKWYGAAINIVFAMVLLFYLRKLIYLMTRSRKMQLILSVGFILMYGVVNAMVFIRMYVMVMCWSVMLSYFALRLLDKVMGRSGPEDLSDHPSWYHLFRFFAVSVFAALTQFYCIVFIVALVLGMMGYLLAYKQWKPALILLGTAAAAGLLSLAIFPRMIEMVFKKDRGEQSVANLGDTTGDLHNLHLFLKFINDEMFGGLLALCVGIILVPLLVYFFDRKSKGTLTVSWMYYIVLFIPVAIYLFIIGITSPMQMNRYMYILYPIVYVMVFSLMTSLLAYMFREWKKVVPMLVGALLSVCLVCSYILGSTLHFEYLYRDYPAKQAVAQEYKDLNAICIYTFNFQRMAIYEEAKNYKSITFLKSNELYKLKDLKIMNDKKLILIAIWEQPEDDFLLSISKADPHIRYSQELFDSYEVCHTYLLY